MRKYIHLLFGLSVFLMPLSLFSQDSTYIGHTGYIRSGFGVDGNGNPLDVFKAPNSEAKYRLGNEAEAYAETVLTYGLKDEQGAQFETNMRLAFVAPTSSSNSFQTTLSLREAYVKANGLIKKNRDLSFWAGQRFYSQLEVHIKDYFPRDMTGFGGGVSGIKLGSFSKLALALLGGSIDQMNPDGTVRPENQFFFNKSTVDLVLYDIDVGLGSLSLYFDLSQFSGDVLQTEEGDFEVLSDLGWSAGLYHEIPFDGGRNFVNVFYGTGAAHDSWGIITAPIGLELKPGDVVDPDGFRRFRVIEDLRVDFNSRFSLLGVLMYQHLDNNMAENNIMQWYSAGIRPAFFFNRYFSMVGELGWDYTSQEGLDSGHLLKATIAPSISPLNKILSRPVLRAYFTYAAWSDSFRGEVAPISFPEQTAGISFGLQMEVWW